MKKLLLFVSVLFAATFFTDCSSDDWQNNEDSFDDVYLTSSMVYPDSLIDTAISDYLDSVLSLSCSQKFFDDLSVFDVTCIIINSKSELMEFNRLKDLPEIDFKHKSLIIGQMGRVGWCPKLTRQYIENDNGDLILNLDILDTYNPEYGISFISYYRYYWGVYPKILDNKMKVNINISKLYE